MENFCMVVANSAEARFYTGPSPVGTLTEVGQLTNETARKKEQDLVTDKPGRMRDDGQGRSAMERDVMEEEVSAFARQVSDYLDKSRAEGKFGTLSIVAEPRFLGHLRKQLQDATSEIVLEEVAKNVDTKDLEKAQGYLSRISR